MGVPGRSRAGRTLTFRAHDRTDVGDARTVTAKRGDQLMLADAQLRSALERAPEPRLATAIHFELGRVFEQIEEPDKSREHFRAAAMTRIRA